MNLSLFAGIAILLVIFGGIFVLSMHIMGFRQTVMIFSVAIVILVMVSIASKLISYGLVQP